MKENLAYYVMNSAKTFGKYKTIEGARKALKQSKAPGKGVKKMQIIQGGLSNKLRKQGIKNPELRKYSYPLMGKLIRNEDETNE